MARMISESELRRDGIGMKCGRERDNVGFTASGSGGAELMGNVETRWWMIIMGGWLTDSAAVAPH